MAEYQDLFSLTAFCMCFVPIRNQDVAVRKTVFFMLLREEMQKGVI